MSVHDKVSTGIKGFDDIIDKLRLGDNVVWQVDDIESYQKVVLPYAVQARNDGRRLVYVRFGQHMPLLDGDQAYIVEVDASRGFESFAIAVHSLIEQQGQYAFYVFDCLTDLLDNWYSDLMIRNFFKVTCPFLFELDTIAYFAIRRSAHTYSTIAGIRETTQLLLDLYSVAGESYIHPLKVWQRYSPTMFFPHLIRGQEAVSITASAQVAGLFSSIDRSGRPLEYLSKIRENISAFPERADQHKDLLLSMLVGTESRMRLLCERYFTLEDLQMIASRIIGTGRIGGKSVGMLAARKIIETEAPKRFMPYLEPHDSFYIGSDVFYTYIVQNGWWDLRTRQKTRDGYYQYAGELKQKLLKGQFPADIQEQFVQMLEYFGQFPIIVRSSSLLEDNYGNAFAGKYDSVFCVNQGTPKERLEAFEQAVRFVYASTMNEDALVYRDKRGLLDSDEQMAILVQRVSGDYYGHSFFPHVSGVGNSSNLYVWDRSIDGDAGMLRLVFGLGTRAVGRMTGDYARIVSLDDPTALPPMALEDQRRFSQHEVDVLSLDDNLLVTVSADEALSYNLKTDKSLFASVDRIAAARQRELGYTHKKTPWLLQFKRLLEDTEFPALMKDMLSVLSGTYEYPVDIEFTANFNVDESLKINLVQCRPLQTRGYGNTIEMPKPGECRHCFFSTQGGFMGGNANLAIDFVVYVDTQCYLARSDQEKYSIARMIGQLNTALKDNSVMLMGPGRWGTTTPSLGVPVSFAELCNMSVICELASADAGFMPELSYGSHFFQDLVESDIFYVAIFDGRPEVIFDPSYVSSRPNILTEYLPQSGSFIDVIKLVRSEGLRIYSDVVSQRLVCQ